MLTPLLLALLPAPDDLTLDPAPGLRLRRTFVQREVLESATAERRGFGSEVEQRLVVVDERVNDDELRRVYEEITHSTVAGFEDEGAASKATRLVDHAVTFTREATTAAYAAHAEAFRHGELALLRGDLDLGVFLPEGEVEVGDRWTVAPTELDQALDFLAGVPWERDGQGPAVVREATRDDRGVLGLTYLGVRTVDGARLAVVEVHGELDTDVVLDQRTLEGPGGVRTETAEAREVTGELRWDLDHGHLASLTLEVEVERVVDMTLELDVFGNGELHRSTTESHASGTVEVEVVFERLDRE